MIISVPCRAIIVVHYQYVVAKVYKVSVSQTRPSQFAAVFQAKDGGSVRNVMGYSNKELWCL